MPDAAYFRKYRAAHPEYMARERARSKARKDRVRGDRSAEYAKRNAVRVSRVVGPLPLLFPHLQRGAVLSFWDDELRIDLEQERVLATLEGRDPTEAVQAYRSREINWWRHTRDLAEVVQPSARQGVEE